MCVCVETRISAIGREVLSLGVDVYTFELSYLCLHGIQRKMAKGAKRDAYLLPIICLFEFSPKWNTPLEYSDSRGRAGGMLLVDGVVYESDARALSRHHKSHTETLNFHMYE